MPFQQALLNMWLPTWKRRNLNPFSHTKHKNWLRVVTDTNIRGINFCDLGFLATTPIATQSRNRKLKLDQIKNLSIRGCHQEWEDDP